MRILICGDRNWNLPKETATLLHCVLQPGDLVIHGGSRGADSMAGSLATKMGLQVVCYPARWDLYRSAAGPIRNQQMLERGQPEMVLALHTSLPTSTGTIDMVRRSTKAGIDTFLFNGQVISQL